MTFISKMGSDVEGIFGGQAMLARMSGWIGALVAIALVVAALWGWSAANHLVDKSNEPGMALWAVRSGAIAAFAAAQVLGLAFVAGPFYGQNRTSDLFGLAAGIVCGLALLCAMTLGLVSR